MEEKNLKNSIPKLISAKIMRTIENVLVAKQICNMDTESEIKSQGDTVYFTGLADPTVKDYNGTIEYENLKDSKIALLIDQEKYVAFKIGKIDDFQSKIDAKSSQLTRSAYVLQNEADKFILAKANEDGLPQVAQATTTSANTLSFVSDVIEKLEENNVMGNDRFMVVTPWFKQKLMLAGIAFQINNGMEGEKGGISYADYQDTMILVSNNVYTDGTDDYMLAGSFNSLVFADQILDSEVHNLQTTFGYGYASLYVYGAKVAKRKEIVVMKTKKGAETTI